MTQTQTTPIAPAHARCWPQPVRQRLGAWDLVERVSAGSLTELFRARAVGQSGNGVPGYAVKVLHPRWQHDPRAVGLVQREALVGRTVSHAHLVSVLDSCTARPPQYVVMPWLEGIALREHLAGGRRLEAAEALWIARQTAEGLDALHRAGWRHGDIKPSNILIGPDGHATLLDLGFAQRADETGSAVDRCVLGTCAYLAPEYVVSSLRADIRSDIYSLGAVLFEMLTGRPPYPTQDLAELAAMHLRAKPPDLSTLCPHVPEAVAQLVRSMLSKDPLRRPHTPGELVDRLVRLELDAFCRAGS